MEKERTYIAIDLKSFYGSVECVERKLDPLTTHLVVAAPTRTDKTICLAVTPSLKAYGISGRARLFEVVRRVKEINAQRLDRAVRAGAAEKGEDGRYHFRASSWDARALADDPSLELTYRVAPPRMRLYEAYSTRIVSIYTKYVAPEDIHVYSIDEVFLDVTDYLGAWGMTAHALAMTMIREVLYTTGITATAGIGTNLYLAKVAMDIVAKHVPADRDGVRIAELNEQTYRELLWCHRPLTDFWRVGPGIARRLERLRCFTMGDVARMSLDNEDKLYRVFGINAELLIDHAWGWEPVTLREIKAYRPAVTSLSSGQVLMRPYACEEGRLIVREMTELLVLDLVRKGLVTKQVLLTVSYDRESLKLRDPGVPGRKPVYQVAKTGRVYTGTVTADYYGRASPKHAHGTGNIDRWTSSTRRIMAVMMDLFQQVVDPDLLIRRINVTAANLIPEGEIPAEEPVQLDLFTDSLAREYGRMSELLADEKEKRLQKTTLRLQSRYGRNAVLKGMNLEKSATTMARNGQIGGHKAE